MEKLLIIDGHNLLFQMFFGMPSRIIGKTGKPIQGVIGFIGALGKLINMLSPTYVIAVFDGEKNNPRKEISKEYKANRIDYSEVPEEENPFSQLDYIYRALDYIGIKHAETTVCETDDVIASYALKYASHMKVYISSFDSDYFQLINDNVSVIRYRGDSSVICDVDYVKQRYGIEPRLYADFKCLVGDNSDNIPGIRGIGPKTAAKIINELGNIDNIIANVSGIENKKLANAILGGIDILTKNRALIELNGEADMPFTPKDARYDISPPRTMEIIRAIGL